MVLTLVDINVGLLSFGRCHYTFVPVRSISDVLTKLLFALRYANPSALCVAYLFAISYTYLLAIKIRILDIDSFGYCMLRRSSPPNECAYGGIVISTLFLSYFLVIKVSLLFLILRNLLESTHYFNWSMHKEHKSTEFFCKASIDLRVQSLSDKIVWVWKVDSLHDVASDKVHGQEVEDSKETTKYDWVVLLIFSIVHKIQHNEKHGYKDNKSNNEKSPKEPIRSLGNRNTLV